MILLKGNQPFIRLKVKFPNGEWKIIEFLIDTGFNSGITLPYKYEKYFPKDKLVKMKFFLAGGTWIMADVIPTQVKYGNIEKEILAVFVGDSIPLVGIEFLNGMEFCLDLKNKKATLS